MTHRFSPESRKLSQLRQDNADGNIFFARELEHIENRVHQVLHPTLLARQVVPADPEPAPASADERTYRVFERFGEAGIGRSLPTHVPRADVAGKEVTQPILTVYNGFGYSVDEIQKSMSLGRGLDRERAMAAERAAAERCDELISLGHGDLGIEGFLNNTGVATDSALGAVWSGLGADAILADINQLAANMSSDTNGILLPTALGLPTAQYTQIAQQRIPDSDRTILEFLMQANPFYQRIFPWYRLDTAAAGGAPLAVAFVDDPMVVSHDVPLEFTMLPPQEKGYEFEVPAWMKCAGAIVRHPRGIRYLDGI